MPWMVLWQMEAGSKTITFSPSLHQVIKSLQSKEAGGEGLSVPSTGTRAKGVKR